MTAAQQFAAEHSGYPGIGAHRQRMVRRVLADLAAHA